MVTSCYRRMGNYHKALELYEQIHSDYPDNVECGSFSSVVNIQPGLRCLRSSCLRSNAPFVFMKFLRLRYMGKATLFSVMWLVTVGKTTSHTLQLWFRTKFLSLRVHPLDAGLRYLVAICRDQDRPFQQYQHKLTRLDRSIAGRESTGISHVRIGDWPSFQWQS